MRKIEKSQFTIIGSGPAAFFLAKKILEETEETKVIVFEAGSYKTQTNSDYHPINIGKNLKLENTIHVGYGGTSNLWHNVLSPLDEVDFFPRPWLNLQGWPIRKKDLIRDYLEVSSYFELPFHLFDNKNCPINIDILKKDINITKNNVFENKIFLQPKKYFRSKKDFDLLKKKYGLRLNINYDSPCLELISGEEDKIVEVVIGGENNKITRIPVNKIILCAGLFGNIKILMNSKLPYQLRKNIGQCIFDHPMGVNGQVSLNKPKEMKLYTDTKLNDLYKIKTAVRYTDEYQFENKKNNSAFYFRPSFSSGYDNVTEITKLRLLNIRSKIFNAKIPFEEIKYVATNFNIIKQIIQYKTGLLSSVNLLDIFFVSEQMPLINCFSLSNIRDSYGYKKIEYNWRVEESDKIFIEEMINSIALNILNNNDMSFTYPTNMVSWTDRSSSAAHHLGGCIMGDDPNISVVDKNSKVYGYSNFYISDGSVFASAGNANPTLTIMALSNRLGRHLSNV